MRTIFGDTCFFVALLSPKDLLHQSARALRAELQPFCLVTSEMVLVETLNEFSARGPVLRAAARGLVEQLMRSAQAEPERFRVLPQTSKQFFDALALYRDRPDKSWSLTDCASCLAMQGCGTSEALTYDRHFEQMGFKALMREH